MSEENIERKWRPEIKLRLACRAAALITKLLYALMGASARSLTYVMALCLHFLHNRVVEYKSTCRMPYFRENGK